MFVVVDTGSLFKKRGICTVASTIISSTQRQSICDDRKLSVLYRRREDTNTISQSWFYRKIVLTRIFGRTKTCLQRVETTHGHVPRQQIPAQGSFFRSHLLVICATKSRYTAAAAGEHRRVLAPRLPTPGTSVTSPLHAHPPFSVTWQFLEQ